ncbi:hypothetical protein [Nocardioides bruguierae]|uniref:Uncharacterized protein n=1 Tax=Nocardioides bruguierae TaxID=2945102 RepID=A0A9X2D8P8_9ACTN|nr:hypothetical protein [Nocardioides bruguierae]MCM0621109.1 hypothetical protein [Nocardioides bruguierae]
MKIVRKAGIVVATAALGLGLAAVTTAPAQAVDTSWGCGGYCKIVK